MITGDTDSCSLSKLPFNNRHLNLIYTVTYTSKDKKIPPGFKMV